MEKIKFPKAPEIKVNWGTFDPKYEEKFKDFKDWVERMIIRTVNDIYKDMDNLGYELV